MAFPVQLVLGILGNGTSLALYLSPMVTFWGIYKDKSTKNYSCDPYVCTLFTCALWVVYASPLVKPNSILVLTISGAGFILEIFYLFSFLIFAPRKTKVMTMRLTLAMTIAFVAVVAVTIFQLHSYSSRQLVVGTMCMILSIVMYASPLSAVKQVVRTKSVEYMPFLLSLFNTLNALVWSAYSILTRDIFMAVPNGIGFVLGVIQLTVYFIYRNPKHVLPLTTELSNSQNIHEEINPSIPEIVEVKKSDAAKVEAVNPVIADHV